MPTVVNATKLVARINLSNVLVLIDASVKLIHGSSKTNKPESDHKSGKFQFKILIHLVPQPTNHTNGSKHLETQATIF